MKISIVIPAHNEEAVIEATIQSALNQNYPDFEIIVVDNNSTDKTTEIAQKYNLKLLFEKRKGTGWARECGRKEATGEIIVGLDADCLPEPDWLLKGSKWFTSEKVSAVTGPYDYFDSSKFYRWLSLLVQRHIYYWTNVILHKTKKGGIVLGGNVFLRAKMLEEAGGYNTEILFYGDDTDTAKRMAQKGSVIFDRNLTMKTSSRRLKKEGVIKISIVYFYHFFKTIFS